MAILYLSAADSFKKKLYDVSVPAYYQPHLPPDFVKKPHQPRPKINRLTMTPVNKRMEAPFYQPLDPHQMERASYSIERMIDMHEKHVTFTIINDYDLPSILTEIDDYLLSLKEDVRLGVDEAVNYARLVVKFRKEIYKDYYRYMKTNPTALEELYPGYSIENNLFAVLGQVNQGMHDIDPLRTKQHPPYDIDQLIPKSEGHETKAESFGKTLGISANHLLEDDGRDFNFQDFLGKNL